MTNHADLIQNFIKTRHLQEMAKADLDEQKTNLQPWEENHRRAKHEHDTAKKAIAEELATPGAKFITDSGSASLSNPKTTIVREVDMEALLEWAKEQHPRVVDRFTNDVKKTPAPRLTVKEK